MAIQPFSYTLFCGPFDNVVVVLLNAGGSIIIEICKFSITKINLGSLGCIGKSYTKIRIIKYLIAIR